MMLRLPMTTDARERHLAGLSVLLGGFVSPVSICWPLTVVSTIMSLPSFFLKELSTVHFCIPSLNNGSKIGSQVFKKPVQGA